LRERVNATAGHRCGYCQSDEANTGIPMAVEHIVPLARGGKTEEANLWLSCDPCNQYKGVLISAVDPETGEEAPLFHPRQHRWRDHFEWTERGTVIVGRTAIGRATVVALQLNRERLVGARRRWVVAGWHPPPD
jgi:5-methylcytosine-specific restriction endonuclease McrA